MYIDYLKAYKTVPYPCIVKIHPTIVTYLKVMMKTCITAFRITSPTDIIETNPIIVYHRLYNF